ncbi:MAG: cellulase family glycosylhydrolase [Planctomycetota bacterium]|nr:cellulase family glycosylhydrolase [Planctomycetota bacterium]MDA1138950.1 cellulase family glycosylhydrolase [Planctomycetota bacterium]
MSPKARALSILLFLTFSLAYTEEDIDASIKIGELVAPEKLEVNAASSIVIPITGKCENPFDRSSFRVVANITEPDGVKRVVPGYYMVPHEIASRQTKALRSNVKRVRIELPNTDWPKNRDVTLYLDDLVLSNAKTGKRIPLSNAETINGWNASGGQLALSKEKKQEGQSSLAVSIKTGEGEVSPGAVFELGKGDWNEFDDLEFSVMLDTDVEKCSLRVTVDSRPHGMHSEDFTAEAGSIVPSQWARLRIRLPQDSETSTWKAYGEGQWCVRFFPRKAGEHRIQVLAESPSNWAKSNQLTLLAEASERTSLLRVSPRNRRYFETMDGKSFFPVGLNVCWADPVQYEIYLKQFAAGGGNLVRLWMCPWNFELEWQKVGDYNQEAAAKMDYVFQLCEKYGLKILLCLDYHGALKADESWPVNPYNAENGGPCKAPEDFFDRAVAQQAYQNRLRYLIARYGGSPSLVAWELFNEVGLTDPYRFHKRSIMDWHSQMTAFLKKNDSYPRLVSTSIAGLAEHDSPVWRVGSLDFVQAHRYHRWRSFSKEANTAVNEFRSDGRPVMLSEFGLHKEAARNLDPDGLFIHNSLWAATMSGAAGSPMPWWWDHHIQPFMLYNRFTGISTFTKDIDFAGQGFEPYSNWNVQGIVSNKDLGSVFIQPDQTAFDSAPFNAPQEYTVNRDGSIVGPVLRAETIHGITSNPKLHNPQIFHVDYAVDGTFGVIVTEVSNFNPSDLRISLDNEVTLQQAFEDQDPSVGSQYRYNKVYRINVPAGKHMIVVDNHGHDWIKVAYVLENYRTGGEESLGGYGIAGPDMVLLWLTVQENIYYARHWGIGSASVIKGVLNVRGLTYGDWEASVYNTTLGEMLSTTSFRGSSGKVELPSVVRDVAVKLVRKKQ